MVSWNTADLLDRALTALPEALAGLEAEVVVVDNASADSSVAVARSHRGVEVVSSASNVGYARAMNEALMGTRARALLALNPDTEASPGSLRTLVTTLDEEPRAGMVAPRLVDSHGMSQVSVYPYPGFVQAFETGFVPRPWRRDGLRRRSGPPVRTLKRRWVIGAVHCIRAAALGPDQPYSTRWFMYAEDMDLCWRLEAAGWKNVVHQDAIVVHHGNAAARQRWGEGTGLELRSLPNIYEWMRDHRSPLDVRATALTNVISAQAKRWGLMAGATAVAGARAARWDRHAADLKMLARFHAVMLRTRVVGARAGVDGAGEADP